jgi:hypothetical protein
LDGKSDRGTISVFSYTTGTKFDKKMKLKGQKIKVVKYMDKYVLNPIFFFGYCFDFMESLALKIIIGFFGFLCQLKRVTQDFVAHENWNSTFRWLEHSFLLWDKF